MPLDQDSRIRIINGPCVYFDMSLRRLVLELAMTKRFALPFPLVLEIDGQPVTIEAPPDDDEDLD